MFPERHKIWLRRGAVLLFWFLVWQLAAVMVDNSILLVPPIAAFRSFLSLLGEPTFWRVILTSLGRIGSGFALGFVTAVLLAVLSYRFRFVEELLSPVVGLIKTIPVVSFVVLLLIWWGASVLAVIISFLVVLPGIYLNTLEGLRNVDKKLLEMANVFRIPAGRRFLYIYRPALRPFVLSGLKAALGMCWKAGVAAEVIGTPDYSIGERLYLSKIYLATGDVFAWTAVIILLSIGFEKLLLWLVRCFFIWTLSMPVEVKAGLAEKTKEHTNYVSGGSGTITCERVTKKYGDRIVHSDVTLCYEQGSVNYLRNPSGSGKTTLLRLIGGLEHPDEGTVTCDGRVSMMFQEDRLCEEYSAVCNVALVTGNVPGARKALERVLEPEALYQPCGSLSGGMKRRVALVRAMEADADIVLLDEPFTGMDADTRRRAETYIEERRQGRTLVIATHIGFEKENI